MGLWYLTRGGLSDTLGCYFILNPFLIIVFVQ